MLFTSHGWGASARAHVHTPFPDLGNRWAHCAEISWGGGGRDPVAMCFMQVLNLVFSVLLGPEHDSDSLTSLRIIVSALLRGKRWILCVADLSLAGFNS